MRMVVLGVCATPSAMRSGLPCLGPGWSVILRPVRGSLLLEVFVVEILGTQRREKSVCVPFSLHHVQELEVGDGKLALAAPRLLVCERTVADHPRQQPSVRVVAGVAVAQYMAFRV